MSYKKEDLDKLSYPELKKLATQLGLNSSGKRVDIETRILSYKEEEEVIVPEEEVVVGGNKATVPVTKDFSIKVTPEDEEVTPEDEELEGGEQNSSNTELASNLEVLLTEYQDSVFAYYGKRRSGTIAPKSPISPHALYVKIGASNPEVLQLLTSWNSSLIASVRPVRGLAPLAASTVREISNKIKALG
jgi:hypothetical protein